MSRQESNSETPSTQFTHQEVRKARDWVEDLGVIGRRLTPVQRNKIARNIRELRALRMELRDARGTQADLAWAIDATILFLKGELDPGDPELDVREFVRSG